jgi:hypothetical protein
VEFNDNIFPAEVFMRTTLCVVLALLVGMFAESNFSVSKLAAKAMRDNCPAVQSTNDCQCGENCPCCSACPGKK